MALAQQGFQLSIHPTYTDLVGSGAAGVPVGQIWRVVGINLCNRTDDSVRFRLNWIDRSASNAVTTVADFDVIPGIPYSPMELELVLHAGDRLQALSGDATTPGTAGDIHAVVTTDDGT